MDNLVVIILAAGRGKRMRSKTPKVLHRLCGKEMIGYVLETVEKLAPLRSIMVVGHKKEALREFLATTPFKVDLVEQREQLGTGDAVRRTAPLLNDYQGEVLVLYGDVPLLKVETLRRLIRTHLKKGAAATILTALADGLKGYGRVISGDDGTVKRIVEEREASRAEIAIREVNAGAYCFQADKLFSSLKALRADNRQGEYYLTDVIEVLANRGFRVEAVRVRELEEILGINSRAELAKVERILRSQVLERLMKKGVTIIDPLNTYISSEVKIGRDTVIYPLTIIEGRCSLGRNCLIGPNTYIKDSHLGHKVEVRNSVITESIVGDEVRVGPFAHLRPETRVGKGARIGNFIEIKKSTIGERTRIAHMSYIGDTTMGKDVNIGAGTITCNYDGKKKHPTYIEDEAFIGSNTNLIAPVRIGKGALIAAGSTITKDVPPNALAFARARQVNKEGLARKKR